MKVNNSLIQSDRTQMPSDDHVCDCIEYESDIPSVSCTREVSVNLFLFAGFVQS